MKDTIVKSPVIRKRWPALKVRPVLIVELVSLLFATVFLYTGASKLLDYTLFREQLAASPLLEPVASLLSWSLPAGECVLALLLLFLPKYRLKGLYVSLALISLFSIYISGMLLLSDKLPCSCGGVLEQLSWPGHLVFNGVLVLLAMAGIRAERNQKVNIS